MVDLNPLHYIDTFNPMFGASVAGGLEFLGISDPAADPDGDGRSRRDGGVCRKGWRTRQPPLAGP